MSIPARNNPRNDIMTRYVMSEMRDRFWGMTNRGSKQLLKLLYYALRSHIPVSSSL